MVASFSNFYGKIWVGFCLNIRKRFSLEFSLKNQQKEYRFFEKAVLGIFKIASRLRDWHAFMWQLVKVLNVFNTLTLIQIFWKTKTFFQNWFTGKTRHFHSKLLCQKSMLRQIEWRLKNGPITKSGFLQVTALFFWKICFGFRIS